MPVIPRESWESPRQHIEYLRHLAAYELLAPAYIRGRKVLEVGCGSGYGAHAMSDSVSGVVAIDISRQDISAHWEEYRREGKLDFALANGIRLPFASNSFDVVISFQVIEHIEPRALSRYLGEIRRVLRTGGIFVCSTPNRRLRLLPFQRPWNSEHKREYDARTLIRLLRTAFDQVTLQCLCASDVILATEKERVRQSPLRVYIVLPSHWIARHVLPPPVLRLARELKRRFASHWTQAEQTVSQIVCVDEMSLTSFRVDSSCHRECLDLYGVCIKGRP